MQESTNIFKIPGTPLEDIIENFEQYCMNTIFDLQDNIDILKRTIPSTDTTHTFKTLRTAHHIMHNRKAVSLLPLLKDISFMIHYLYEVSEEEELENIWMYENMEESRQYIQDKYNTTIHTEEGTARVTFIFDNFVIKCDKTDYSSQTEDECNEYISTIVNAALYDIQHHALMPPISFMEVNDIVFQIFPKAMPYLSYDADWEWLLTQNYLRHQLLGEGICLDQYYNDLYGDNLGLYNNKLYIIDAGSISDLNEQGDYVYKDYSDETINAL